jgi:stage II sporulation protein D
MFCSGKLKKIIAVFLAWACILSLMPLLSERAFAAESGYIRVGLTGSFAKVPSVTILNTDLKIGVCTGNTFYPAGSVRSANGITVTPETGTFVAYKRSFDSYSRAVTEAATLSAAGSNKAYACLAGKGAWKVYEASKTGTANAYMLRVSTGNGSFLIDGAAIGSFPQFADAGGGNIKLSSNTEYRGRIEIGRYGGASKVSAVNVLPLEDYVKGVVTCEMPRLWPLEALKAQAVCARSYGLLTGKEGSSGGLEKGYSIGDSENYQVYRGVKGESEEGRKAVEATRGQYVLYNNRVIRTYYFSTSGGSTETAEDVWGKGKPYLQSVPDIYETEPEKQPWVVTLTASEIESSLLKNGYNVGTVKDIKPAVITMSGHIYGLKVTGSKDTVTVEKGKIRSVFGLPSTKFKVVKYGEVPDKVNVSGDSKSDTVRIGSSYVLSANGKAQKADSSLSQYMVLSSDNITGFASKAPSGKEIYEFAGSGYGHAVGLSQSGAKGMAKAGFNYKDIISHYFSGSVVR